MKVFKYYIIRMDGNHITYMKDSEGVIFEFDTEEEVRAFLDDGLEKRRSRNRGIKREIEMKLTAIQKEVLIQRQALLSGAGNGEDCS